MYLETSQTPNMDLFANISPTLTIFKKKKGYKLDVWLGLENADSRLSNPETYSLITVLHYLSNFRIKPFHANVPFLYPLKTSENLLFSDASRGIEMEHWREKG